MPHDVSYCRMGTPKQKKNAGAEIRLVGADAIARELQNASLKEGCDAKNSSLRFLPAFFSQPACRGVMQKSKAEIFCFKTEEFC